MLKISRNGGATRVARKVAAADQLHDKQSERDHRELRIDKVGVRGLRFPIQVRDKARAVQNTVATIGMFVDLPKEFKGTHMSRFIEVLNAHGNVIHVENITDILHAMQKQVPGRDVAPGNRVSVFHGEAGAGDGQGKRDGLHGAVRRGGRATAEIDFVLTVKANVTTLCPCSKAIAAYGAHNQRGEVTVQIRFAQGGVD